MNKYKNVFLYKMSVLFISSLFVGSFIISRDFSELFYLLFLYSAMLAIKINNIKDKNHTEE